MTDPVQLQDCGRFHRTSEPCPSLNPHEACDRRIALLESLLEQTTLANAELREALVELYEPNHRLRPGAKRCDVCGRRWPCAHYEAALLIHGDDVGEPAP